MFTKWLLHLHFRFLIKLTKERVPITVFSNTGFYDNSFFGIVRATVYVRVIKRQF